MASKFRLQIVNADTGAVVQSWHGGDAIESDIIETVLAHARSKHVGIGASTKSVEQTMRAAWHATLHSLKKSIPPAKR